MTTDIETELRDLFREKAGEAPLATPTVPAAAPPQVLRRGRLHQVGTVLGSAALVLVLLVGSVLGLQALLDGDTGRDIGGTDEVFERTATVEAFTVTSPSDWYLVNQWPLSMQMAVGSGSASQACTVDTAGNETCTPIEQTAQDEQRLPAGLPMFQLTNVDLGLDANACQEGIPGGGAVLYVALDAERALAGLADPSIPPFPPASGLAPEDDGPCGPGRYERFTVNEEPFFAWIGLGSGVSDQDRETVETSYEQMSAIDDWKPATPDHSTPGYVIAAGASEDRPWRLEVRPGHDIEFALIHEGSTGRLDIAIGSEPVAWCCQMKADPVRAGDVVLFGGVRRDASGVEFRSDDGATSIPGVVVPPPPSLGLDFDLFFLEGADGLIGDVFATGVGGDGSTAPPPPAEARADIVELSGTYEGVEWTVRFTGSFADRNACVEPVLDGEVFGQTCSLPTDPTTARETLYFEGWSGSVYLRAGFVPVEVVEIRFVSDDDAIVPTDFRCETGPSGWIDPAVDVCVQLLPSIGSGTVQYLDAEGRVVSKEGIAWGTASAAPLPTPVEPVHGGTYWAVYAWLGGTGGPESNAVVGRLFDDFGVQAHQGDINCDQGAAEVVGPGWTWRVAVYFETDRDAELFAKRTDLIDAGPWFPIAEVTTYCLD